VLGNSFIHVEEIDFLWNTRRPSSSTPTSRRVKSRTKSVTTSPSLSRTGATIQIGIGGIPNSLCRYLTRKKHLGVHSEVISDGLIDLIREGVVDCSCKSIHPNKVVATFAMGGTSMYGFLNNNPIFEFHPTEYANSPLTIARNHKMTAINSALTVDLTGQVNSDSLGYRFYSGIRRPGDFMRGAALAPEGRPIIALPVRDARRPVHPDRAHLAKARAWSSPGAMFITSLPSGGSPTCTARRSGNGPWR